MQGKVWMNGWPVLQEIHFNNTDMIKHFGQNLTVQLPAVINQLQEYRQRGLRIHYWP